MDIKTFVKQRHQGEGRTRVIDENGKVIIENFINHGGISIDWISAKWVKKKGRDITNVKYDPETFRFF